MNVLTPEEILHLQSTYIFHIAVLNEVQKNGKSVPLDPNDPYFKVFEKYPQFQKCWKSYLAKIYEAPTEDIEFDTRLEWWHQDFMDVYQSDFRGEGKDRHAEREKKLLGERKNALESIRYLEYPRSPPLKLNLENNGYGELVNIMQLLPEDMKFAVKGLAIQNVLTRIEEEHEDYRKKNEKEKEQKQEQKQKEEEEKRSKADQQRFIHENYGNAFD